MKGSGKQWQQAYRDISQMVLFCAVVTKLFRDFLSVADNFSHIHITYIESIFSGHENWLECGIETRQSLVWNNIFKTNLPKIFTLNVFSHVSFLRVISTVTFTWVFMELCSLLWRTWIAESLNFCHKYIYISLGDWFYLFIFDNGCNSIDIYKVYRYKKQYNYNHNYNCSEKITLESEPLLINLTPPLPRPPSPANSP